MPLRLMSALIAALALPAAAGAQQPTAQQERMKTCNAQAKDKVLQGDKRQDFMSQCLRADSDHRTSAAGARK